MMGRSWVAPTKERNGRMSKKLEAIMQTMDIIQSTYSDDTYLALFDTEKLIAKCQGQQIQDPVDIGTNVHEKMKGTVSAEALRTGKRLQQERDASRLGVPYISTAVPVWEDGRVVGCFSVLTSTERYESLRASASDLSAVVEEMSATTEEVSNASQAVAINLDDLTLESSAVADLIQKVHSILTFVQDVAAQSNLLGLNASIEAARAGNAGAGFAVVASEIRNMANNSKKALHDIKEQLDRMQQAVDRMNARVHEIGSKTKQHAASMQELNSAFIHIAQTAEQLASATVKS